MSLAGGFDTGFVPNINNTSPGPQRSLKVTTSTPMCKSLAEVMLFYAKIAKGFTADRGGIAALVQSFQSIQLKTKLKPCSRQKHLLKMERGRSPNFLLLQVQHYRLRVHCKHQNPHLHRHQASPLLTRLKRASANQHS